MKRFTHFGTLLITAMLLVGAGCVSTDTAPPAAVGDLPDGQGQVLDTGTPEDLARLDLSSQGLEQVPDYVFGMTELQELDLSNNQLTGALPAEIRHLKNLRILDVSGNKMTGVPAEVGQLSELEELDLSDNELTGLPLELGNLSNLKLLDLRGNDPASQDLEAIRSDLPGANILE